MVAAPGSTVVQVKGWDKAHSLAVTQEQFDYVKEAVEYDKQVRAEASRPKATSCYTAGNRVMCY